MPGERFQVPLEQTFQNFHDELNQFERDHLAIWTLHVTKLRNTIEDDIQSALNLLGQLSVGEGDDAAAAESHQYDRGERHSAEQSIVDSLARVEEGWIDLQAANAEDCIDPELIKRFDQLRLRVLGANYEELLEGIRASPLEVKSEASPNGLARCRSCGNRIEEKDLRVGIPHNHESLGWIYHYFHREGCCPRVYLPYLRPIKEIKEEKEVLSRRSKLMEKLRQCRSRLSRIHNVQPYIILDNATIQAIALSMPKSREQLRRVYGMKQKRISWFGDEILSIVEDYEREHPIELGLSSPPRKRPKSVSVTP